MLIPNYFEIMTVIIDRFLKPWDRCFLNYCCKILLFKALTKKCISCQITILFMKHFDNSVAVLAFVIFCILLL